VGNKYFRNKVGCRGKERRIQEQGGKKKSVNGAQEGGKGEKIKGGKGGEGERSEK